jgi:pSer/pThr/pTyr-binding forkhead associated (FHA) protein
MDLLELLHLCVMASRTGVVIARLDQNQVGQVFFRDGRIVSASLGDKLGEEALFVLLQSTDAKVEFRESLDLPTTTISKNPEFLLVEAARKLDELKHQNASKAAATAKRITSDLKKQIPILILISEQKNKVFQLPSGEITIGRAPTHRVCIPNEWVSVNHCRLVISGFRATIEDTGSLNGTFVNGLKVEAPTEMVDSDLIQLGPVLLYFHWTEAGEIESPQGEDRGTRRLSLPPRSQPDVPIDYPPIHAQPEN